MIRVKSRIFTGVVCEQEIYTMSRNSGKGKNTAPRIRFATEEDRQRHKDYIARRDFVRLVNDNFTPDSLYVTLTFDNEHEIHCPTRKMQKKDPRCSEALKEAYKEAREVASNYIRRLKRINKDVKIVLVMGRGEKSDRIHFHAIIDGITEEEIIKKWDMGYICRIENLREANYYEDVNHGRDYTKLALYLLKHWEPDQGTHRFKKTRTVVRPEVESVKIVKRNYTEEKAPAAPKGYILVETKSNDYGYLYYKYILDPAIQNQNDSIYRRKRKMR